MSADDGNHESFEDRVRAFARELGRSAERMAKIDVDEIAESLGVDPDRAKDWADTAGRWLREQFDHLGEDIVFPPMGEPAPRPGPAAPDSRPAGPGPDLADDPLRSAAPHPLDMPTDQQGAALAALDSGRWTVEAASKRLTGHGDGAAPSDTLGLVRELHARDWIDSAGQITLVGRRALSRWLDAANHH